MIFQWICANKYVWAISNKDMHFKSGIETSEITKQNIKLAISRVSNYNNVLTVTYDDFFHA